MRILRKNNSVFFLIVSLLCSALQATSPVYVVPYGETYMTEHLYRYEPQKKPIADFAGWFYLDKELQNKGHFLQPINLSEKKLCSTAKVICYDAPCWIHEWQKKLSFFPKKNLLLIAYEPPSVRSWLYTQETISCFGKVLTWNDDLVDNKKFFKFFYPALLPMLPNTTSFSKKKLLTQITTNRSSQHPHELYTERMKAIEYFEKKHSKDFVFYGRGWNEKLYKTYGGEIENKYEVLKQFRFSLCYENIKKQPGYITEKIFDCFAAGCVPIYLGAPNITQYIPKNCFISRSEFKNYDELHSYLKSMKEDEYNKYIENIPSFFKVSKQNVFLLNFLHKR